MQERIALTHRDSSYEGKVIQHSNLLLNSRHQSNVSETKIFDIFWKPKQEQINSFRRQSCSCLLCGSVSQHSKWLNQYSNTPAMHTKIEQRKKLGKRFRNAGKILISMIRIKNSSKLSTKKKFVKQLKTKMSFMAQMYKSSHQERSPFIKEDRMVKTICQSSSPQSHQQGQFIERYVKDKIQSNTIATLIRRPTLRIETMRSESITIIDKRIQSEPDQHVKDDSPRNSITLKKSQNVYLSSLITQQKQHDIHQYYVPVGKCVNKSMYKVQDSSK